MKSLQHLRPFAPGYQVLHVVQRNPVVEAFESNSDGILERQLLPRREALDAIATTHHRRLGESDEDRLGEVWVPHHEITLGQARQFCFGGRR